MHLKRRSTIATSIVCVALLVTTATVGAATITGTAGNDTLRGGAKADKLTGKGGNDKLFGAGGNDVLVGGAGNDLLVGGPGADRLSCGAGRDTARGDANDTVARDCEIVKGVPTAPPTQPPPAQPPTQPPPAAPATAGQYKGQTQNGNFVFFTVTANLAVTAMRINDLPEGCNGGLSITGGDNFGDSAFSIRDDGTFAASGNWDGSDAQGDAVWTHWDVTIAGRFDTATSASGTIVENYRLTYKGTPYQCSSGTISWTATLQP
jgi:RTX calcium-binding nonapeptide repeat (4 copies)